MAETLDALLVRGGIVTQANLTAARADAARTRKRLPETLIDLGMVTERRFAEWMAQSSRTPLVHPIAEEAAAALQHHVPRAIARELQVVPVRLAEGQLFVAMVNALDGDTLRLLESVTRLAIRPVTGVRSEIERLVNRFYPAHLEVADITMLPPATVQFELEQPAPAGEEAPFDFSNETLLRRPPGLDFLRDPGPAPPDEEFGTIVSMKPPPELQFLREPSPAPVPPPAPVDEEFGTMMSRRGVDFDTPPPVASDPPAAHEDEPRPDAGEATAPTNPLLAIERRLDQIVGMIHNVEKRLDDLETLVREQGSSRRQP